MMIKKKWALCIAIALTIFVVCIVLYIKSHTLLLYGDFMQQKKEFLREYVAAHYVQSLALFMVIFIMLVLCAIPLIALFTCLGGFLFGTAVGTCAAVVSATIGATLFFLMMRYFIGSHIQSKYKERLRDFNDHIARNGVFYLLSLRFVVVIPFFVVNTLASMTRVSLPTFIVTTVLGILPGDLVYAFVGSQFGSVTSLSDVYSGSVASALLLLALFSLLPVGIQQIKDRLYPLLL